MGDEDWQLSKDSADAATAVLNIQYVRRQREYKKRNRYRNRSSLITEKHDSGSIPVFRNCAN